MRVHKAILALYCATGANAFVAPAVVEPRTTRLRHHKVKSQVAELKIYREEIDWETGAVVQREVEAPVDAGERPPVVLRATYADRRGEDGQGLALPPVFGGVGAAVAAGALALQEPAAALFAAPALLGAAAFALNELRPVPVRYAGDAEKLGARFAAHASPAMRLVLEDVTRHRYFAGVHLEPALRELGLAGRGPDPPALVEAELSGGGAEDADEVTLSLVFASPEWPYKLWDALDREGTLGAFFGCAAEVEKLSQAEKRLAVRLSVLKPAAAPEAAVPIASAPAPAAPAPASDGVASR